MANPSEGRYRHGQHDRTPDGTADPAGAMQPRAGIGGMAMVLASLRNQEAARLTVEHLVRKVPLDRERVSMRSRKNGTVMLEVAASPADVDRIAEMLCRHGRTAGRDSPSR